MRRGSLSILAFCICALSPPAAPAQSLGANAPGNLTVSPLREQVRPVQYRQCSRRVGPFVTQTTAWQRWRQARNRGYAVSRGVVPCYGGGGRGYCFNVFYPC
jgi:hypothetical protein